MPPPIPRAPLRSLANTTRLFSTTTARRDVPIPPESPKFIPLPNLPQSEEVKRPFIKGHLPVPRAIFPKRAPAVARDDVPPQLKTKYLHKTASRSLAERAGKPPKSERDAWKRRMAGSRRDALATGLHGLWRRKTHRDERARARADARLQANLADLRAPERLDEVYTRGTVTQATLNTAVIRDPLYAERQHESQLRTAQVAKTKSEARKDAIQRIYVEAKDFILTEQELVKRVENVFSEDYFKRQNSTQGIFSRPENVWQASGPPPSVRQMFAAMKGSSSKVTEFHQSGLNKTTQRQKIVAGELAGGALSVTSDVNRTGI